MSEIIDNKRRGADPKRKQFLSKRYMIRLRVGQDYLVLWQNDRRGSKLCKFIKTSDKGHNFLDEETNSCILKHPLYESKYENHKPNKQGSVFWVNEFLKIEKAF